MPPKKQLTRKEKRKLEEERKKKEEEERKRIAEEKAAEEKKRKEEEEARRKYEEETFNAAERDRLNIEQKEYMHYDINLTKAINKQEEKLNEEMEWNLYLAKGNATNISDIKQVNHLMSAFKEINIKNKMEIEPLISMVGEVQTVCHELSVLELKYKIQRNKVMQESCRQYITDFQRITIEKMQDITYHVVSNADHFLPGNQVQAKEVGKKVTHTKNDTVQYSKPDLKLGYNVSYVDKNHPRSNAEFPEINIKSAVPVSLKTVDYIMRVLWTSFDYLCVDTYTKEMAVGGVINITAYDMPEVPSNFKGWKIKSILERDKALTESSLLKQDNAAVQRTNPIRISYKLPSNLYTSSSNTKKTMAIWLKEKNQWALDSDYIERELINTGIDNSIEFQTYKLAPICCMQSKFLDFPYKSWKLRSISENDLALLDIEGKRLTLKFEIGAGWIKLRKTSDKEFSHLFDKQFEPVQLFYELYRCGVNLLPCEEDGDHCGITSKSADCEDKAIADISLGSRGYFFKNSKWSAGIARG